MAVIRIHELSKELKISSKEIIAQLAELGIEAKSHMSSIDAKTAKKLTGIYARKEKSDVKKKPVLSKTKGKAEKPVSKKKSVKTLMAAEDADKTTIVKAAKEKKAKATKVKEAKTASSKTKGKIKRSSKKLSDKTEVDVKQVPAEKDEGLVTDKIKKEVERDKLTKFKVKPGMQRAFDSIRRVETSKKGHNFNPRFQKYGRRPVAKKVNGTDAPITTAPRKKVLKFEEGSSVKEFAETIGQKLNDVIKKFMDLGYMPTINQPVDADAAQLVAEAYDVKIELTSVESEEALIEEEEDDEATLSPRPPIVTIMGHVDHGKTTLLDAIRETKVTESEAGGITQHIGAYKVKLKDKEIAFLDTPGHEAFTMMRARGAKVTDIVILVVAADDSVMPQTIEAIDHAKAAGVPIIVAINKIDKPDANIQKVKTELASHEVVPEDWGGKNIFVEVSATEKTGIKQVLEMILLQSEVMELKANYEKHARGTIVEAKLDRGRGPIGTVLVNAGTLNVPVEVIGFPEVPQAGDVFVVMDDEKKARQLAMNRLHKQRTAAITRKKTLTLDELYERVKEGEIRDLNIVLKADVQGSVEAVRDALSGITHSEVQVNVIHTGVGGINESDVMLATASNAIIIGFNIRPDANASRLIEKEGVDVRLYNVIYEAIEDVKKALEGLLEPTITEKVVGRAEVRNLFYISRLGTIAGCHVIDGKISRADTGMRVIRENVVIYENKISSLKRFKEDTKEVLSGFECGIMVENFNDLKVGDVLESYIMEEVATKLE